MRFAAHLRNFSLGLSIASFALAGGASALAAQNAHGPDPSTQSAPADAWNLVGVNARLVHAIDTSSAKSGETVQAKLDGSVKTADGTKLAKGTLLIGTVARVEPSGNGGPSRLTLDFTSAQLKDGKQLPVKVTLLGAYPSNEESLAEDSGVNSIGPAPRHVNNDQRIDQEPGVLNHIALRSSVQGQNSGTFTKKDGNLKLQTGTFLQLGIAAGNSSTSSGE
ncbi:MAG TPA: hypothetical protein VMD92_14155 [Acidobacteriaceae bacterium]|nr:hypothetical protein [Acidobacteriaceae bacterium]